MFSRSEKRRRITFTQDGVTALMHAVIFGKLDCLKHLIAKGADLQATDNVSAAPPAAPSPPRARRIRRNGPIRFSLRCILYMHARLTATT